MLPDFAVDPPNLSLPSGTTTAETPARKSDADLALPGRKRAKTKLQPSKLKRKAIAPYLKRQLK